MTPELLRQLEHLAEINRLADPRGEIHARQALREYQRSLNEQAKQRHALEDKEC